MGKSKKHKISYEVKKIKKGMWGIFIKGTTCSIAASRMKKSAKHYCDRLNENLIEE